MSTFVSMLRNWWTTSVGFVGGFLVYVSDAGLKFPATEAEVAAFIKGLALLALGFVAKSATTGSRPK